MSTLSNIESWADHHHPSWVDFFRIVLGFFLVSRGVYFINHSYKIGTMVYDSSFGFEGIIIATYVVLVLAGGGILMILGLRTRVMALFALPILVADVFFVNLPQGFTSLSYSLWMAIALLVLTLFFLFFGSGKFSLDYYLKTHKDY